MQGKNEIGLEQRGVVTLLDIRGDLTARSEPFLAKAFKSANDSGASRILLKFDERAYINSDGIKLLLGFLADSKRRNQETGITGLSGHFQKIFRMIGITKLAKMYRTVEEAVAAMSG